MTLPAPMERSASLSADERYRYWLLRQWDASRPKLIYVMLNPSTADGREDDATIRVCCGRAAAEACGGIIVVNLYAYRATKPADMWCAVDPVGPENNRYLSMALKLAVDYPANRVVAAWGNLGYNVQRERYMLAAARASNVPLHCLGTTQAGHPKHPLRIPYAQPLIEWPTP